MGVWQCRGDRRPASAGCRRTAIRKARSAARRRRRSTLNRTELRRPAPPPRSCRGDGRRAGKPAPRTDRDQQARGCRHERRRRSPRPGPTTAGCAEPTPGSQPPARPSRSTRSRLRARWRATATRTDSRRVRAGLVVEARQQHLLVASGQLGQPIPDGAEHDPVLGGHRHIDCVGAVGQLVIAEPRAPPAKVDRQPAADDGRPSETGRRRRHKGTRVLMARAAVS